MIEGVRSIRSELNVPAATKLPLVSVKLNDEKYKIVEKSKILIERLARISSITHGEAPSTGAIIFTVDGNEFALKISGIIDFQAEIMRLGKAINKINLEADLIAGKLANEKFVLNAPNEVVNEAKSRLLELKVDSEKLSLALKRIEKAT